MMTTERMLQFCVSMMAALATLMLGTSQESSLLPIIGLVVALASLFFTDYLGWFSLHPIVAGTAGVIAGVNAFVQSQAAGLESQFISVANLLIHLQIILLFQKKAPRIYWQLITLSLLQVVVAAALNLFVMFGPLLVLYTCFAISAMLLFFVYRQVDPYLMPEDQVTANSDQTVQVVATQQFALAGSAMRPRKSLLSASYVRDFFMLGVSTIVVSAGVFLLMPRFGNDVWRAKSKPSTGLSEDEVDLQDVGSIYENPTIVMRVSFLDETTNEPYRVSGYPYFRGVVHEVYRRGKWRRDNGWEVEVDNMPKLKKPTRVYSAVRQRINLEAPSGNAICGVAPSCAINDATDSLHICERTLEVRNFSANDEDVTEFEFGTLGFQNGLQSEFLPAYGPAKSLTIESETNRFRTQSVRNNLPELTALASKIVANIPEDQILLRARALERHFTNGREGYKYSLDPSPKKDPARWNDPVEDFVMNHKTGHCQFFASGLALMLRSQGIPSRIVLGFRADTYNVVGGYYQLRALDAHAWVEAAIPADQVPVDEIMPTEGLRGGAWVRLDPTPGDSSTVQSVAVSAWRQQLGDSIDYMQLLWSEYVLGLNEKRQRKAIYEPIMNAVKNTFALVFSREVWTARWEAIRSRFEGDFFTRDNLRDGVVAIVVLTLAFYALRFLAGFVWRLITGRWGRDVRRGGPRIEFYRRLETILGKHGIRRDAHQTHSEFAVFARQQLQTRIVDSALSAEIAEIPGKVVDLFYRVRFGNDRLDTDDLQRLENWLGSLQKSLASR